MTTKQNIERVVKELMEYGQFLGTNNGHQYYMFDDGSSNHYYDVTYVNQVPVRVDKLDVMLERNTILEYNIEDMKCYDDIQFGGF